MLRILRLARSIQVVRKPKDLLRIAFVDGYALIYENSKAGPLLKWFTYGSVGFMCLNSILWSVEHKEPLFGDLSETSFIVCGFMGAFSALFLHLYSRRVVHRLQLQKDTDMVRLHFLSAFTLPRSITVHVSEFQNPQVSFAGMLQTDLTGVGKVWLDL
jgi:hypothetical protein